MTYWNSNNDKKVTKKKNHINNDDDYNDSYVPEIKEAKSWFPHLLGFKNNFLCFF